MLDLPAFRWTVIEGPTLPSVSTPMILRPGEVAHLQVQRAVWRELRGSPGSLGVTGALTVVEMGRLYVTSQRVILDGVGEQKSVEYSEIDGVAISDGMLIIQRIGNLDPYLELNSPALLEVVLLLIERARRGGRPLKEYLDDADPTPDDGRNVRQPSAGVQQVAAAKVPETPPPTLDDLLAKLDKLVGLASVKAEIRTLVNVARVREIVLF